MLTVHQRMAELWTLRKNRKLTEAEQSELFICLEANANHMWQKAKLENLSLCASMTQDYDWLHDICVLLEKLEARQ